MYRRPLGLDIVDTAAACDVAGIVLFTMLYDPRVRAIVERVRAG